ncbi:Aminotransferase class V-fold PLP-dependent enzyme [[Mycoplasma] cavipharyngis]|uniref:aminotransferase class V-fold PLP-dependent enzyme n=1 Tax=[Mycoplasma] cavipharyngis TaxID=92757 RepID=UPI0037039828
MNNKKLLKTQLNHQTNLLLSQINKLKEQMGHTNKLNHIYYFDHAATSFKPKIFLDGLNQKLDDDNLVQLKQRFINCASLWAQCLKTNQQNLFFTNNTTYAINFIAYFLEDKLSSSDQILLNYHEHSSNLYPWQELARRKQLELVYFPYDQELTITNILKAITPHTKIIPIANSSNITSFYIDIIALDHSIKKIRPDIILVVDATQFLSKNHIDLTNSKIDFLVGSFHKLYTGFGVGFFYANDQYLDQIHYSKIANFVLNTQNFLNNFRVIDLLSFLATEEFLKIWSQEKTIALIDAYEQFLINYFIDHFPKNDHGFQILNQTKDHLRYLILTHEKFVSEDLVKYFAHFNIIVASGIGCAKFANLIYQTKNIIRISFSFFNTLAEINFLLTKIAAFSETELINCLLLTNS